MAPPSLATQLAGVALEGPLVLASGILGVSASSMGLAVRHGAHAVTTKSCSLRPRKGHPGPVVAPYEQGLLNAVGLSNPGAEAMAEEIRQFKARFSAPVIASVFGADVEEFAQVTEILAQARPQLFEVNVSCPNVAAEFGQPFASDPQATERITRQVVARAGGIPVSVKLSTGCLSLAEMAQACQRGGARAITAINTVGPGMIIDPQARRPVLSNLVGGLSGPAILPLAVKAVWEIRRACSLPIIGTGGVESAEGALQLLLAGASALGLGTALYRKGLGVLEEINQELSAYLAHHGEASLPSIVGAVHG